MPSGQHVLKPVAPPHKTSHSKKKTWVALRASTGYRVVKVSATTLFLIFITMNLALLVLQRSYMPPFASVEGISLSFKSKTEASQLLTKHLYDQELTFKVDDSTYTDSFRSLGLSIDSSETINGMSDVQGFSTLPVFRVIANLFSEPNINYGVNEARLNQIMTDIVDEEVTEPISAKLVLENSKLSIAKSEYGSIMNADVAVEQVINSVNFAHKNSVVISPRLVAPSVREGDLQTALFDGKQLLGSEIELSGRGGKLSISKDDLAKVLKVQVLAESSETRVVIDKEALTKLLQRPSRFNQFFKGPTATVITIRGGEEVKRVRGTAGYQMNMEATVDNIYKGVNSGTLSFIPEFEKLAPTILYAGEYPRNQAGLQSMLNDFVNTQDRGIYGVQVTQLRGGSMSASFDPDKKFVPASTYKVFGAVAALKEVERGNLSYSAVAGCVSMALTISDNDCGASLINMVGRPKVDQILKQYGMGNTSVQENYLDGFMVTTARDEATLLEGVYKAKILNRTHSDIVIGHLHNQVIKWGIPNGSPGSRVASKVGYVYDYHHDMGIVYGPKADYVVTILTKDSTYYHINDLALRLDEFFD